MKQNELVVIPFFHPLANASLINLLNPSATSGKRRGERGHPRLRHLSTLNNEVVDPFIRKVKAVVLL